MRDHISKGGSLGPFNLWHHFVDFRWQVLGGLTDNFQIANHGIEDQLIGSEGFQCHALGVPNHLIGGFKDVFHLKGGILSYLEKVPETQTMWQGECFVFDQRVSVGHDLAPGSYDMCHACRTPLTDADQQSPAYVPGVSCPHCQDERSDQQRKRYLERQRQIEHAKSRGAKHLGSAAQARQAK